MLQTKPKILLIDDEPSILNSLLRLIEGHIDCHITTFTSANDALRFLEANEIDVIMSDIRMPELDGVSFMHQVSEKWPLTERILLTGYSDMEVTVGAINEGHVSHFLQKPWEDEQLLDALSKSARLALTNKENIRLEKENAIQNEQLKLLNGKLDQRVKQRTQELHDAYDASIRSFVQLVELRLKGVQYRSNEAQQAALYIARIFGMDDDETQTLVTATLLRNIGKMGFSDSMLHTPFSQMSQEQKKIYYQHPLLAHSAIIMLAPLASAANTLLCQQENLNASGYPNQLEAKDIPLSARILHVIADYFDALDGTLFDRRYTIRETLDHLDSRKGKILDEHAVNAMRAFVEQSHADDEELNQSVVAARGLTVDMRLTKDLYTHSGLFLLAKGKVIDSAIREKLLVLEKSLGKPLEIHVTD